MSKDSPVSLKTEDFFSSDFSENEESLEEDRETKIKSSKFVETSKLGLTHIKSTDDLDIESDLSISFSDDNNDEHNENENNKSETISIDSMEQTEISFDLSNDSNTVNTMNASKLHETNSSISLILSSNEELNNESNEESNDEMNDEMNRNEESDDDTIITEISFGNTQTFKVVNNNKKHEIKHENKHEIKHENEEIMSDNSDFDSYNDDDFEEFDAKSRNSIQDSPKSPNLFNSPKQSVLLSHKKIDQTTNNHTPKNVKNMHISKSAKIMPNHSKQSQMENYNKYQTFDYQNAQTDTQNMTYKMTHDMGIQATSNEIGIQVSLIGDINAHSNDTTLIHNWIDPCQSCHPCHPCHSYQPCHQTATNRNNAKNIDLINDFNFNQTTQKFLIQVRSIVQEFQAKQTAYLKNTSTELKTQYNQHSVLDNLQKQVNVHKQKLLESLRSS